MSLKVPKYIQEKMHRVAKLNFESRILSNEIDEFFIGKGLDIDTLRCGNGLSLEELDLGNDITDQFVAEAEDDFSGNLW